MERVDMTWKMSAEQVVHWRAIDPVSPGELTFPEGLPSGHSLKIPCADAFLDFLLIKILHE